MSKLSKNIPAPMSHRTRRWNDDIGKASSLAPEFTVVDFALADFAAATGGIAFPQGPSFKCSVSHCDSTMKSPAPLWKLRTEPSACTVAAGRTRFAEGIFAARCDGRRAPCGKRQSFAIL